MKLKVISSTSTSSSVTVSDEIFAAKVNQPLLAQAVRIYQLNQRQGTSQVKTRSEVKRTKSKWYRQKGTGNARHGARTANLFVGGGIAHGPKGIENWSRKLPKVMKDKALKTALTLQTANILVNDGLVKLDGKTSSAVKLLNKMTSQGDKVLVVLPKTLTAPIRSLRNLSAVLTTTAPRLNVLQVVSADKIIITKEALKAVEQRLTKPKEVKTPIAPKKKKVTKTEKK